MVSSIGTSKMTLLGQKRSAENASGAPDTKKQHMSWDGMDILSIRQFDADRLQFLCDQADRFRAIVKESGKCELPARQDPRERVLRGFDTHVVLVSGGDAAAGR